MSLSNDAKSELMVKAFSYIHILNNRGNRWENIIRLVT